MSYSQCSQYIHQRQQKHIVETSGGIIALPVYSFVSSFCFYVPVLQFVGAGDDPRSCRFSQMMEQRLEKVFSEAQAKVLNINSRLSVQVLRCNSPSTVWVFSLLFQW